MQKRNAQMAESVDALVSNTSGFTSIPVRPRVWVLKIAVNHLIFIYFIFYRYKQGINFQQKPPFLLIFFSFSPISPGYCFGIF